jgi:hypothetical protein
VIFLTIIIICSLEWHYYYFNRSPVQTNMGVVHCALKSCKIADKIADLKCPVIKIDSLCILLHFSWLYDNAFLCINYKHTFMWTGRFDCALIASLHRGSTVDSAHIVDESFLHVLSTRSDHHFLTTMLLTLALWKASAVAAHGRGDQLLIRL